MKYYDKLLQLGLFSKKQINELVGNTNTAKTLLAKYVQNGYIEKIQHNYYVVKSLETKQPIPDRFAIGSNINKNSYISHHTAFEYYGMSNRVFSEVYVSSTNKFQNFIFDNIEYKWLPSKIENGIVNPSPRTRVTDLERTIIDNIKDFNKIGGLEELLRCLSMVTFVNENNLLIYLKEYNNQFLYQKVGYILSHYQKSMKLNDTLFENCKANIRKSVRYLFDEIKYENPIFYKEWQLFAPANLTESIDERGG